MLRLKTNLIEWDLVQGCSRVGCEALNIPASGVMRKNVLQQIRDRTSWGQWTKK